MSTVWVLLAGLGLGLIVGEVARWLARPRREVHPHRGPERAVRAAIPREVFERIADTQPFGLIGPSDFDAWVIGACMRQLAELGEELP